MKEALCRAFCDGLNVRDVPAGLAVRTGFMSTQGDFVGFYVRKDGDRCRLEDSGTVYAGLEAQGLDFSRGQRGEALSSLLDEYSVALDMTDRQFVIEDLSEATIPAAALRFVAFLLRVSDFALMTEARIVSTFRDDVKKLLVTSVDDRAELEESVAISPELADFPADFVLRAPGRRPVGVYLATGDNRVMEAAIVQMRALYETHEDVAIIALVESGKTLTAPVRRYAGNRLTHLGDFRGDELAAVKRIVQETIGQTVH